MGGWRTKGERRRRFVRRNSHRTSTAEGSDFQVFFLFLINAPLDLLFFMLFVAFHTRLLDRAARNCQSAGCAADSEPELSGFVLAAVVGGI